ncbi:transcription initiation factor TFIID subunit 7-like [Camelus dromedarius]|uniref:transcription initiation factor TFIID subunit 7-like n=1 Tax=Camelus dromedarius TaxID=9838 RepID=UPI0003C88FC3
MERPKKRGPSSSGNNLTLTTSTSQVTRLRESQTPVGHGDETAGDLSAQTTRNQGTQTPDDNGAQAAADIGTQAAAKTPLENLLEGKEMSKSQDEPPHELENQFILRLPLEQASTVRKIIHSQSATMKDKLKIDLSSDGRHAVVEVDDVSLAAKLVDLPCVIGSLKTVDKKTFYKTADISQMLVCTAAGGVHSSEEPVTSTGRKAIKKTEKEKPKKYAWKHGITPPLKNVKKKRFRKTTKKVVDVKQTKEVSISKYAESPEVEKEVRRLLCSDAEAVCARWEVIAEGETKEIECQGSIPGFEIAPGISGYKQGHTSPECDVFPKTFSNSSSNSDDEDEDEDEKDDYDDEDEDDREEEYYYEEDLERELQAKFIESGQYEAKEGASSMIMEIHKQTYYMEKKLQEIRCRAQRQKELIMKLENLTLKNHLQSVLEQLKLQEKQKTEQLISLREQLNNFLKE